MMYLILIPAAFAQAPVIDMVDPNTGHQGEPGLMITIIGSNFDPSPPGAQVFFQDPEISVISTNVINSNTIEVIVDIGFLATPGPGAVFVINPNFEQGVLPNGFTVLVPDPPAPIQINPDIGFQGDSNIPITITGDLLYTANDLFIGTGITIDSIDNITNNQIDAVISIGWAAPTGPTDVVVISPFGDGTIPGGFDVRQHLPPTINSIDIMAGCPGDTNVDIVVSGTDFLPGIQFDFIPTGNILVQNVNFVSDNQVELMVDIDPGATPGFYSLGCVNPDGQTDLLVDSFEILDCQMTVDSIDPIQGNQGDVALAVSIFGNNLGGVDNVSFGSGITPTIQTVTNSQVDVLIDIDAAATPGLRDVQVFAGIASASLPQSFEVIEVIAPPEITSVVPGQGTQGDLGLSVTVFGTNLDTVFGIDFGAGITPTLDAVQSGQLDVTLNIDITAVPGFRTVTADYTDGQISLVDGFEVLEFIPGDPFISLIDPNQGTQGDANLSVDITGGNFDPGATADFGSGITVNNVSFVSDTLLTVDLDISPTAIPGARDVTVQNPQGNPATEFGGFTVLESIPNPPVISSIDPTEGFQGDTSLLITIFGQDFDSGAMVGFSGSGIQINSMNFIDSSTIEVDVDIASDADLGPHDVIVVNSDFQSDELTGGFTVLQPTQEPPGILMIDPNQATQGDTGVDITVTGTGFQDGLVPEFEQPLTLGGSVNFINSTMFIVTLDVDETVPPGFYDLTVTNPDFQSDTLVDAFEVLELISPEDLVLTNFSPASTLPGNNIPIQIDGMGIQSGAIVQIEQNGLSQDQFFTLFYNVDSSTAISGAMDIDPSTPPGFYDVRVTNPDFQEDVLFGALEVREQQVINPPQVFDIMPNEVCIGEEFINLLISGQDFQDGATVEFEYQGAPDFDIQVQMVTYLGPDSLDVSVSVSPDAPAGQRTAIVTNPDMQSGAGGILNVIDCSMPGFGVLEWVDSFIDLFAEVDSLSLPAVQIDFDTELLNTGDAAFDDVTISVTELTGIDGAVISPEMVELFPSIIGFLDADGFEPVNGTFYIPTDILQPQQTNTFMGSLVATDSTTGEIAYLPINVTIITPGAEFIEIDPTCLQVDLLTPGYHVDDPGFQDYFSVSNNGKVITSEELIGILGGCVEPFPQFEWFGYGFDCEGYMETWSPEYTISVYPIYPSQSPEEAVNNPPVWMESGIQDTFIQYPPNAEQLDGVYVWQIQAEPAAYDPTVEVFPLTPVFSQIFTFCVQGGTSPIELTEGNLEWVPGSLLFDGCGMQAGTVVLSNDLITRITADSMFELILENGSGDQVSVDFDPALMGFSQWNPDPSFGPAAIDFGFNFTPVDFVGNGMNPSDIELQVYYNGEPVIEGLDGEWWGESLYASFVVDDNISTMPIEFLWPWDDPCWEAWLMWWDLKTEQQEDCNDQWDAFWDALDDLNNAEDAHEDAWNDYLDAFEAALKTGLELADAQSDLDDAQAKLDSFMEDHVFVEGVGGTPESGSNHVNYRGVDIYFSGVEMYQNVFNLIKGDIDKLADKIDHAQEVLDNAQAASDAADEALDNASDALDEALNNHNDAQDAFDAASDALHDCWKRMEEVEKEIAYLEWLYEDCFGKTGPGTGTGLGAGPGTEGGPQPPPINGGGGGSDDGTSGGGTTVPGTGPGAGPGTGVGPGSNCDNCGDCAGLLDAYGKAVQDLADAEQDLADAQDAVDAAQTDVDNAQDAVDAAQDAFDDAQDKMNDAQSALDTFMEKHVFSNSVGGTPDYGPNYVNYMGVDIYFSDYNTFSNIFDLIKDDIKELADELDAAENEAQQAALDLALANADLAVAQAALAAAQANLANAQNKAATATLAKWWALAKYKACLAAVNLCRALYGCPPLPDQSANAGQPGGNQPGAGGGNQPGGGTGTGGSPPGTGTGTGTGTGPNTGGGGQQDDDCPCGDCDDAWNDYLSALDILNALQAKFDAADKLKKEADQTYEDAMAEFNKYRGELIAIEARLEQIKANPEGSGWTTGELFILIKRQIELQELLTLLEPLAAKIEEFHQSIVDDWNRAKDNLDAAKLLADYAWEDYLRCMQDLNDCEEFWGCPQTPVQPRPQPNPPGTGGTSGGTPGGTGGPGDTGELPLPPIPLPPLPGDPGGFGPIPGPVPGPVIGGNENDDCPCEDCLEELLWLRLYEEIMEDKRDAWDEAFDDAQDAEDAHLAALMDELAAQAESDDLQDEIDDLQKQKDEFIDKHVFVSGMGGQAGSGPNSTTYKGVTIYFTSPTMFSNVFNLIKKGIDKLDAQMKEVEGRKAVADAKLAAAKAATAAAQAALAAARAAEQVAWGNYLIAVADYLGALADYKDCIQARADCLKANPGPCAGEKLEPPGGIAENGNNSGGKGDEGKAYDRGYVAGRFALTIDGVFDEINDNIAGAESLLSEYEAQEDQLNAQIEGLSETISGLYDQIRDDMSEYAELQDQFLKIMETLPDGSAMIWSDYNTHDPGMTVMEIGNFDIVDLGAGDVIQTWARQQINQITSYIDGSVVYEANIAESMDYTSDIMDQIHELKSELVDVRMENASLRGLLGSEASRLDYYTDLLTPRIDTLQGFEEEESSLIASIREADSE